MAEGKKSFVLYTDLICTVEKMTDKKAGELFKHILQYVNDQNPITEDMIIQIAFEPIKQQLKRDLLKWGDIKVKRSEAGKASAEKRQQNQQVLTSVESVEQKATKSTVSDNVNVTVTVNENVIKNTIDYRKKLFCESIEPLKREFGNKVIDDFARYWTEPNQTKTKMRFELEKTWDTGGRLRTWKSNELKFNKNPPPKLDLKTEDYLSDFKTR